MITIRNIGTAALLLSVYLTALAETKLQEPSFAIDQTQRVLYGDQRSVELLAGLLSDKDELAREAAVQGLGQTDNPLALPHLQKALEDSSPLVRGAVMQAAANLAFAQANPLLTRGLSDSDSQVVYNALRSIRINKWKQLAKEILPLTSASKPTNVQAVALWTLTSLGVSVNSDQLTNLLASKSSSVRMRACENLLLATNAKQALGQVKQLAKDANPAIAAKAIEALGKFAFESAAAQIDQAAKSDNPLLRRGALLALVHAGKKARVPDFLNDRSVPVRLVALKAVGDLNCTSCVGKVFSMMLKAPFEEWARPVESSPHRIAAYDRDPHFVARESLRKIGNEQVIALAANHLAEIRRIPEEKPESDPNIRRNIASAAWLLGQLKSNIALDDMLRLLGQTGPVDLLMGQLSEQLGLIGDRRAIAPLAIALEKCKKQAQRNIADVLRGSMQPAPYSGRVARQVIQALGQLNAQNQYDLILQVGSLRGFAMMPVVLPATTAEAIEVLGKLAGEDLQKQQKLIELLAVVIADENYSRSYMGITYLTAVRQAGRMKVNNPKITKALQDYLNNKDKRTRLEIYTTAWALQEITGTTPKLPNPTLLQGEWIIRQIENK